MAFIKNREQFLNKSGTLYQMVIFSTFDSGPEIRHPDRVEFF